MAERVVSTIAAKILTVLQSLPVQEMALPSSVKEEIDKLIDTLCTIKGVLIDAEEQHSNMNEEVTVWLRQLKDALYDAHDLLEDFSTEVLRRRREVAAKEVCNFFSKYKLTACGLKMVEKIKTIRETLDEIATDRARFHFTESVVERRVLNVERETHSFVYQDVIGRDEDKIMIISRLLHDSTVDENVSVIPMVGIGGLGKTTLAKLVYNDDHIINYFQLRMWVNVSDNFDVKVVVEKIIESAQRRKVHKKIGMSQLQKRLNGEISGKKYFLVLDDVWNEDYDKWNNLKNMLMHTGARGSKILVTTRSNEVAGVVGTVPPYILRGLTVDQSWSFFMRMAFEHHISPNDLELVEIGKELFKRCVGIPLAIRILGRLLYNNNSRADWLHLMEVVLAKEVADENDIFHILKLSYGYLPSHLKQCFAYCALFPKDYGFEKQKLIYFWMAQEFLPSPNENQYLEDVGNMCFMNLLSWSFFQDPKYDKWGNVITCKMHDLVHDLAKWAASTECTLVTSYAQSYIHERCIHLSLDCGDVDPSSKFSSVLPRAKCIRTLILLFSYQSDFDYELDDCDEILSSSRFLRTLMLENLPLKKLSNSIGELKHLHYLNLSNNFYIEELPDSISRLGNLETLDLCNCRALKKLPQDSRKMLSLRHIIIEGCDSLIGMPYGLGLLTSLRTLPVFVAPRRNRSPYKKNKNGGLDELNELNNLRGKLTLKNLGHMENSKSANLEGKQFLQSLILEWDCIASDGGIHEALLEGLKPHSNLKEITIKSFMGLKLSSWLFSLKNLTLISIVNCERCQHIPPFDQFPFLESLYLEGLDALRYISEKASNNCSSTLSTTFFPSLKALYIANCPELEGWWRRDDDDHNAAASEMIELPAFPCLSKLQIIDCPKLTFMPLYPSLEDLKLCNTSWKPLQQTMMLLNSVGPSNLKSLTIARMNDLEFLPSEWLMNLNSLEYMSISSCQNFSLNSEYDDEMQWKGFRHLTSLRFYWLPKLVSLPQGLQYSGLQYLKIEECPNLMALPDWIRNLTSLVQLHISNCPQLSDKCGGEMRIDWNKIAHIQNIIIDLKWIQSVGRYQLNRVDSSSSTGFPKIINFLHGTTNAPKNQQLCRWTSFQFIMLLIHLTDFIMGQSQQIDVRSNSLVLTLVNAFDPYKMHRKLI